MEMYKAFWMPEWRMYSQRKEGQPTLPISPHLQHVACLTIQSHSSCMWGEETLRECWDETILFLVCNYSISLADVSSWWLFLKTFKEILVVCLIRFLGRAEIMYMMFSETQQCVEGSSICCPLFLWVGNRCVDSTYSRPYVLAPEKAVMDQWAQTTDRRSHRVIGIVALTTTPDSHGLLTSSSLYILDGNPC